MHDHRSAGSADRFPDEVMVPRRERAQVDDLHGRAAVGFKLGGGLFGLVDRCSVGDDGDVIAGPDDRALSERDLVSGWRKRVAGVWLTEQVLVLEEQHRILNVECRPKKTGGIGGARRERHQESGDVREDRLAALGVPDGPAGEVAPDRHAQHERTCPRPVGTPADRGGLGLDLLHGGPDVIEELHFRSRPKAPDGLADRSAHDVRLGQRGVEAAGDPEVLLQPVRGAEHAPLALNRIDDLLGGVGHVLTEHAHPLVELHHLVEGASNRLAESDDLATGWRRVWVGEIGQHVDMLGDRVGVGACTSERFAGGVGHDLPGLVPNGGRLVRREDTSGHELLLEQCDRIVLCLVGELLDRAVLALGVSRGVRVRARHLRMDEPGPFGSSYPGDCLCARLAGSEVVRAVDLVHGDSAKATHHLGDRGRRLVFGSHRDGVAVVSNDVEHREMEPSSRVEALPELTL